MATILCMDNSDTIRKVVQDCVEDLHHQFVGVENGKQGMEIAPTLSDLKLIVLDWNMPVQSGRETLLQIRETKATKDVMVLTLIKIENKDQVMDVIELGSTNYMLKPFRVNDLQDKIEEMMTNAV
ncbi:response regulator [Candidatus Xianfuyuplasma coldseepsis]|uniref:Response regulator n=1 Tax=Candidatus Xianfuyuplasma coldseepsis TaxID=2782163 RepID=A0A7L7KUS4_9MOLU|nr:response regulator [Xianfuyuplasma coldseepsis]QMS85754.1 response regulator [Xianfuyuplasma coldseepsis]